MRRLTAIGATILGLPMLLWAVASVDWRPDREPAVSSESTIAWEAPLLAGGAEVDLTPERPVPLGGFGARRGASFTEVRDPVEARALVLAPAGSAGPGSPSSAGARKAGGAVALVTLDVVLVPPPLAAAVRDRVRETLPEVAAVHVLATHTHNGLGGLWENRAAEWIGLGPYDAELTEAVIAGAAEAVTRAWNARAPARVSVAHTDDGPRVARNPHDGRAHDHRLSVATFEGGEGTIARVVVLAGHPTHLGSGDHRLSAEWPGAVARRLGGTTLVLQGAVGDMRRLRDGRSREDAMDTAAERVVEAVEALETRTPEAVRRAGGGRTQDADSDVSDSGNAVAVADTEAEGAADARSGPVAIHARSARVTLPPATGRHLAPRGLRNAAGNVLARAAPSEARVSVLGMGDLALVLVPGEVVTPLAARWEARLDASSAIPPRVVSLADGYLGYLETPEALLTGAGESRMAYFGADAIAALERAFEVVVDSGGARDE